MPNMTAITIENALRYRQACISEVSWETPESEECVLFLIVEGKCYRCEVEAVEEW